MKKGIGFETALVLFLEVALKNPMDSPTPPMHLFIRVPVFLHKVPGLGPPRDGDAHGPRPSNRGSRRGGDRRPRSAGRKGCGASGSRAFGEQGGTSTTSGFGGGAITVGGFRVQGLGVCVAQWFKALGIGALGSRASGLRALRLAACWMEGRRGGSRSIGKRSSLRIGARQNVRRALIQE